MRKEKKEVSIAVLKTPEKNTRIHPEKQIMEMRRSLKKWGQYKNIVIDENNLVLAGNGLVEAMRAEGMKKAYAFILYDLSENEKKKLMMADNKTAGLGIDNLNNIQEIIGELDGDFDIPGFDDDVLKSINAASDQISAALDDYGKASDNNIAEIDSHVDVNAETSENETDGVDLPVTDNETFEGKAPYTCPKCGAEIWL
ncbi:MAG: hypothetical protein FWB95_02630 [Treponema sp.]|nr:hypothetical protein [Treponema sp.]